ncbi:MAG: SDR family oxidoreductase [Thermoplasmatota archaeon]
MTDGLAGRIAIVTGSTSGIGYETARGLAEMGATVIVASRDEAKCEAAAAAIRRGLPGAQVEPLRLDLADSGSIATFVRTFTQTHAALHLLVNNAGIYTSKRTVTPDGLEVTFATNHFGPFLLTRLLLPSLKRGHPSRIVNVSSEAHRGAQMDFSDLQSARRFRGRDAYARSKLANLLFTYELARRIDPQEITANALHPGVVRTQWARQGQGVVQLGVRILSPFMISPKDGAATSLFLASSPRVDGVTGGYWIRSRQRSSSSPSRNEESQRRLWDESERLCTIPLPPCPPTAEVMGSSRSR